MLTKIAAATGLIVAIFNVVSAFWFSLTVDQLASINTLMVLLGGAVHSWFNPAIPQIGVKPSPTTPTG